MISKKLVYFKNKIIQLNLKINYYKKKIFKIHKILKN